jgi:tRNA G18 (ribose-2'-O)-methylase SpoU
MPRTTIADLNDPRIAVYRSLKATNLTRWGQEFVVEGAKLVARLLASRFPLVSVLTTDRREAELADWLPADVPLFIVSHSLIDRVVGFNFHQGVLGCGIRRPGPSLSDVVEQAGPRLTLVVCPKLTNPENLGAIIRIADVFGVDAVVVGGPCPDPLSRRVLRVSMGTALRVPVVAPIDLGAELERARASRSVELVAAALDPGAEPLDGFVRQARTALVLGNENEGLSEEWLRRCDRRVTIPMRPGAESLNVGVAAGILLYELARPTGARSAL